jgi:hypothetical protein
MTPEQSARWHAELVRADRHWATQHRANPLPSDRLLVLIRAMSGAQRDLELEMANTRGLLARLVEAVTGGWDPKGDVACQAQEALRELRRVEAFLLSLHNEQGAA